MSALLDAKEAAELLRIHPETFREWARRGKIPATKIGKVWRARSEDLEAYIDRNQNSEAKESR